MAGDSYSLEEVSALLGVPVPDLIRRIEEGAFPGRFLTADWEMRIPVHDVRRAVDAMRRAHPGRSGGTRSSEQALVPRGEGGGPPVDVGQLRVALEAWWEDRESQLLGEIRRVLDREDERWTLVEEVLTDVRDRLARLESSGGDRSWSVAAEGWASAFDALPDTSADAVFAELRDLEQLLGVAEGGEPEGGGSV